MIDKTLYENAVLASKNAYAPYSNYYVGASALTESGKTIVGCNVENASYGLTICAETTLACNTALQSAGKILELVCVNKKGEVITPCGRCRQVIYEHSISGKTKVAVPKNNDESELYRNAEYMFIDDLLPATWVLDQ
jgi:cytidine deaminase